MPRLGHPIAVVVAAGLLAGPAAAATTPHPSTTAGNRRMAQADASRLLTRLKLPPGTMPSASEPAGDHDKLSGEPLAPVTPALIDRHRFFVVPLGAGAARRFILTHPPTRLSGEGSVNSVPEVRFEEFDFSSVASALTQRQLVVSLVALSARRTAVRVDAQEIYLVARSPRERVPASARVLSVTRTPAGATRPDINLTISLARTVKRAAALVDALSAFQPGTYSCPALGSAATVTLRFSSVAGGPALATVTLRADADGEGPCADGVSFAIGRRRWPPLEDGGAFLRDSGRLIGVQLAEPSRGITPR